MKLDVLTNLFDLLTARAESRRDWIQVMTLILIVVVAFLLQGCLAGAWLAAVAVDTMRRSHVTFGAFEQSWVAPPDQSSDAAHYSKVTSVAVLPVEGDPEMGARLAILLQQETALRVEVPMGIASTVTASDSASPEAVDDADRSALAKEVSRDLGVDTVLISRVAAGSSPSHPSDWGRKTEGSRRLYLYLMNHKGHLLWKDELPFMLANDSTAPLEASMQTDLSHHVTQHVKELRLDELGYLPKKTLYRTPKKVGIFTR
jgi:hypothetical protein